MLNKKPRLPRIERSGDAEIEDETAHLWAVSYADFLMVLLCFFILFFSVNKDKKESIITTIITEQFSKGAGQAKSGDQKGQGSASNGVGVGKQESGARQTADIDELKEEEFAGLFSDFSLKVTKNEKSLVLSFPENIYKSGSVVLSEKYKRQLTVILGKLKPFMKNIEIVFVGHTDRVPVRSVSAEKTNNILSNNYDLSVLRASKILTFALGHEFQAEHLSARGAGAEGRNTRSLSLIVRPYVASGL